MLDTEFAVTSVFKLLPLILTILLGLISVLFSEFLPFSLIYFKFSRLGYNVFSFFNQRFLIELFYNKYVTGIIFKLGGQTTKVLDKGSVELIGPFGLEKALLNVSRNIAGLDSGIVTSYALYILIGLLIYMLVPYFSLINSSIFLLIVLALYVSITRAKQTESKGLGLEWGLNSPVRPHNFVSLPIQSFSLSSLLTFLKNLVCNKWRLFLGSFMFSLLYAFSIRTPFNYFFAIYGMLGSQIYYLFCAGISILFFHLLRVKNSKDIFYKAMSLPQVLFAGLYGILIAYIIINYLSPIYSVGLGVVFTALADLIGISVLIMGPSSTVMFSNTAGNTNTGGAAGASVPTITGNPNTAPAQSTAPAQPQTGPANPSYGSPAWVRQQAQQAVAAAGGPGGNGIIVVPDPLGTGATGYNPNSYNNPYGKLLVGCIRADDQMHSQFPRLDNNALNYLHSWLAHNRPGDYLPNGVINPNNPRPNLVYPCSKKNLDAIRRGY